MKKKRANQYELERTYLAEERTLYSKERTQLNLIGLGIAIIGLGLVMYKFFESILADIGLGVIILGTTWTIYLALRFRKLDNFVRGVEQKNRKYFRKLKTKMK